MGKYLNITETQRLRAIAKAEDLQALIAPVLQRQDIDEQQFDHAATLYAQAVVMKVRLTSMEGRTV